MTSITMVSTCRFFSPILVAICVIIAGGVACEEKPRSTENSHCHPVHRIKQCAWSNINYHGPNGIIKECEFTKRSDKTALRVLWNGNLRVRSRSVPNSCFRWYFTFNGIECKDPVAIDSAVSSTSDENRHRVTSIEGLCYGIPSGRVNVEFRLSGCPDVSPGGEAYTGWNSASRILVEEMFISY
ncbi:collagen triple helix repeat-containing protein 1-like [Ptychodera flava]|uniref:collagen triple helix repeat-containing protein 1-like n=1 Tax=Ptychodera flava TaxID=63121 RepID=UPI00396A1AF2